MEEASKKVCDVLLYDPEVRSHEDYVMLLIRVGNYARQRRQLLQDAVDGHDESKRMCKALGIEATLGKYVLGLEQQPRTWPLWPELSSRVMERAEQIAEDGV